MPELVTFANGLRVVVVPMPHARSVALSMYVSAGSRFETAADAGLSHFVEHLCFKGTERRPRPKDVAIEIDAMGGSINAATEREYTVYYAKVTPEHAARALDILGDMVRRSLFVPGEVERERGVVLEELAAVEDAPDEHVDVLLDGLLWPGQAHGRDIAGTPETVAAIGRDRLYDYYRAQHVANGVVVAIAGAIDERAALALVQAQLGDWAPGTPATWTPNTPGAGSRVQVLAKDTEQTHLALGLPATGARDADRYPLGLLSVVVGEGMSSRLFLRLREELGLCYDVRSQLTQLLDTGAFVVSAGRRHCAGGGGDRRDRAGAGARAGAGDGGGAGAREGAGVVAHPAVHGGHAVGGGVVRVARDPRAAAGRAGAGDRLLRAGEHRRCVARCGRGAARRSAARGGDRSVRRRRGAAGARDARVLTLTP